MQNVYIYRLLATFSNKLIYLHRLYIAYNFLSNYKFHFSNYTDKKNSCISINRTVNK